MNKFVLKVICATMFLLATDGYAQERVYAKDEVMLELREVSSLIQSSKTEFQDWFLFIAHISSIKIAPKDGSSETELVDLATPGKKIEIMLHKKNCYQELHTAFIANNAEVKIQYLKNLYFNEVPDNPRYEYFLKLGPIESDTRDRAECVVQR